MNNCFHTYTETGKFLSQGEKNFEEKEVFSFTRLSDIHVLKKGQSKNRIEGKFTSMIIIAS
jgi:hypothetical protein